MLLHDGCKVERVPLWDPVADNPWKLPELTLFAKSAHEACDALLGPRVKHYLPKKGTPEGTPRVYLPLRILFVCVGGNNRSKALACAAVRLASSSGGASAVDAVSLEEGVPVEMPECMRAVVESVGCKASLEKLSPFPPPGPVTRNRKRACTN